MLTLTALLACTPELPASRAERWPRVGDSVVIEVVSATDADRKGVALTARGTTGVPDAEPPSGCRRLPAPDPFGGSGDRDAERSSTAAAPVSTPEGVVQVRVEGPASLVLTRTDGPRLEAAGPLAAVEASWTVGDVAVLDASGRVAMAPGAVRFGGGADVLSVDETPDGGLAVRWALAEQTRVELDSLTKEGARVRCVGVAGELTVPRWAVPADRAKMRLRSVQETVTVVANAAVLRVRAVLDEPLPADGPGLSERPTAPPRLVRPAGNPRRIIRYRANWG